MPYDGNRAANYADIHVQPNSTGNCAKVCLHPWE